MLLFERVRAISTEVARSQSELAKRLALTLSTFNGYLNEKRQDNLWPLLPKILKIYPQIRREWLFFDEGEMLRGEPEQTRESERESELLFRISALENELAEERHLNRQLTTRLLIEGTPEKDSARNAGGAAADGRR